ncbi:DUF6333 family protein [Kitasatospora paracochleata]|uniref:Uncharacterized protein n=1 Tax=Kitasatospora paracochleata TaxID=58354 RepID=A0ABT1JAC1_9ACTN|nr:DUF6333 family protein [Kitasatospora paracochleata]MCP2313601.1 hypothetical protein [Kitasatospora paracochleata]
MTDTNFWRFPPGRTLEGYGECAITVVLPPFRPHRPSSPDVTARFAAHDPARARAFAGSFPTIEAVLEELPLTDAGPESPRTVADLDLVRVGCWGNVVAIADCALAGRGHHDSLLEQTDALAERFPEARIVGSASVDCGENHTETSVHLPGGLRLHSEGWTSADQCHVDGDPHAIVRALGIGSDVLAAEWIDLDGDLASVPWEHFGHVLLAPYSPWGHEALAMSRFRVRHTEDATIRMEEVWLPE